MPGTPFIFPEALMMKQTPSTPNGVEDSQHGVILAITQYSKVK
jgi:hypothetical protein